MPAFDPDAYIASQPFDPDSYIAGQSLDVVSELDRQEVIDPEQMPDIGQQESAEEMEEGGLFETITEPLVAIASGAAGQVVSGIAGIPEAITGDTAGATETIKGVQESFAEMGAPETKAGTEALQTVGDFMQAGIDIASVPISMMQGFSELIYGMNQEEAIKTAKRVSEVGVGGAAAEKVFEATGSALMGSIAKITPEILGAIVPISRMGRKSSALKAKIAEQITSGSTDKKLAKYMVNGAGKLKGDSLAKETIKQGFDQGVISAVKGATDTDRLKMVNMVNHMKKGKENALFAMKNRPSDIVGDSLLERVKFIRRVNRNAGQQLDEVAKGLKGKQVEFSQPIDNFMSNLDDMGITINNKLQPIFKGSDIEGLAAPEAAIRKIVDRLSRGGRGVTPDAYELHRMKKYIDEVVTYGKTGEGLAGKTETILKKLRHDLDTALDDAFPQYDKINSTYADTINALDDLQGVAGKKMNLAGGNADKALGTLLRRMMSNAQSRINLVDAVDKLENISKKYGSVFDDDIATQMLFADELDSVFGSVAKTSLAGEVGKGVRKGVETARRGVWDVALDIGEAGIEKARGINEEAAFKSIEELLKRTK